jgi:hypothetical protein
LSCDLGRSFEVLLDMEEVESRRSDDNLWNSKNSEGD